MSTATLEPGVWDCTNREYHADTTCDSHTTLQRFRRSWAAYREGEPWEITDYLRVGIGCHHWSLEPGGELPYVIWNAVDQNGKAKARRGKDWESLCESARHARKEVLTLSQDAKAKAMALAVRAKVPEMADGAIEQGIRWQDSQTGLWLKCRPDALNAFHWELKTADDPSPEAFCKSSWNLGYHRQLALYRAGIKAVYGWLDDVPCRIVAVRNTPPYDVVIHDVDERLLEIGEHGLRGHEVGFRQTLAELAACKEFDQWDQYPNPVTLGVPPWVK